MSFKTERELQMENDNYVNDLSPSDNDAVESKDVTQIHQLKSSTKYTINIPGHAPRTESDVFRATKKKLIQDLDTPCYVCGSKIDRQVHHFILEISLEMAVDWNKLKSLHPDFPDWNKIIDGDSSTYKYFTDSIYNMLVLCKDHHVSTLYGIHCLPYPIWSFQKIKRDDFEFIHNDNVSTAKDFILGSESLWFKVKKFIFDSFTWLRNLI